MPTNYKEAIADAFKAELEKIAQAKIAMSPNVVKALGLAGAGALGYEFLRRAEADRRMGRVMRFQQGNF